MQKQAKLNLSDRAEDRVAGAIDLAKDRHHPWVELEHLIQVALEQHDFTGDVDRAETVVHSRLGRLRREADRTAPRFSQRVSTLLHDAGKSGTSIGWRCVLQSILNGPDSLAKSLAPCTLAVNGTEPSDSKAVVDFKHTGPRHQTAPGSGADPFEAYGRDLTRLARLGLLERPIGRDNEMLSLARTLRKRKKSNGLLLGEPGVGKTAIVEGLACLCAVSDDPFLRSLRFVEIELGKLNSNASYRGEFEGRLQSIVDAARGQDQNIVLFIDEAHLLVRGGKSGDGVDAANLLKPAMGRGGIRVIAATTFAEFSQHLKQDGAITRRFQRIDIEPTTPAQTEQILSILRATYEAHHSVRYLKSTVPAVGRLTRQFLGRSAMPDAAIDVLDRCGALAASEGARRVTEVHVRRSVAEVAGLPIECVNGNDEQIGQQVEQALRERLVGQDGAIAQIVGAVRAAIIETRPEGRAAGVLALIGPGGTGKSLAVETVARVMHGRRPICFNMARFSLKESTQRLVGAPPGYVGYEEGGELTEHLWKHPFSAVVLEDFGLAHDDVRKLFMDAFEEGAIRDNRGRTIDLNQVLFFLVASSDRGLGDAMARCTDVARFAAFDATTAGHLLDALLAGEMRQCVSKAAASPVVSVDAEARPVLLQQVTGALGARPLRDLLARILRAPLALAVRSGIGKRIRIVVHAGKIQVQTDSI